MKTEIRSFILWGVVLLGATFTLHADAALLGEKKGHVGGGLDAEAVKAVLLGKKATLGETRVVLIIAKSSENQEKFLKEHVGMSTSQFKTYWRRLYMTGGGSAPKFVKTEADALKLAAEISGAIAIGDYAEKGDLVVLYHK